MKAKRKIGLCQPRSHVRKRQAKLLPHAMDVEGSGGKWSQGLWRGHKIDGRYASGEDGEAIRVAGPLIGHSHRGGRGYI